MSDEPSQQLVKVLEDIRDLLRDRSQQEQARLFMQRRAFRLTGALAIILVIAILACLFLAAREAQRSEQIRQRQLDYLSHPH
jgi:hypothetical protein